MATRKIHGSWWVDFRFQGIRVRKRSPENSAAGAKVYESVLRQRLTRGETLVPKHAKAPTLKDFSTEWYKTYVLANNKHSEQVSKLAHLNNHLLPLLGDKTLDRIASADIERYKALKRSEAFSPKTINNQLATLSKCLRMAIEWQVIAVMPKIELMRVPQQSFDFLMPDESSSLLRSFSDQLWHAMVLTALLTGMRFGELIGLLWSDIDFRRKIINVRRALVDGVISSPKNNRTRYIPMIATLINSLERLPRQAPSVFVDDQKRPITRYLAHKKLKEGCNAAGIRRIAWHDLRHTFASQLTMAGVPIRAVQDLLGHSTIQMTMRYSHLAPSTLLSAVSVLDTLPTGKLQNFGQQAVNGSALLAYPSSGEVLETHAKSV